MSRIAFHLQRVCCALALWFPRIGVNFVTTWAFFVLIFRLCFAYYHGFWRWGFAIFGTYVYAVTTIAYYRTVSRGGGSPIELGGFMVKPEDLEAGIANPPPAVFNNITAKDNGEMRFCSKCSCWKPDRTHHCRSCKRCVLRMDHHCPWFSTCIGHLNHKFFIQFLVYVSVYCFVCFFASIWALINYFKEEGYLKHYPTLSWIALALTGGVMGLAVGAFSAYSVYAVFTNQTTLEMMEAVRYKSSIPSQEYRYREAPDSHSVGNVFDLGWRDNWRQVMGQHWWEWLLPIVPQNLTNGSSFPINEELWHQVQSQADYELSAVQRQRMYIAQQREIQRREMAAAAVEDYGADPNVPVESIPLTQNYA